jgi:hypothetical protein
MNNHFLRQDNIYKLALIPNGGIKEVNIMSQENPDASHQKCKLLPDGHPEGYAVISTGSNKVQVPLQKRKEQAQQPIYLNRI